MHRRPTTDDADRRPQRTTRRLERSMTIWSTISSTLHHATPSSTSPPRRTASPPPLSNESTPKAEFEFYDPRGLGARVRPTRSRSNTPQATTSGAPLAGQGGDSGNAPPAPAALSTPHGPDKVHPAESPGGTFSTARPYQVDHEGDVTMRLGSEEPPRVTGLPIPMSSTLPPSLPASPTPQARSPPNAGGGVPLSFGGVQRQPSLKARDAFNRLRIGSFGNSSASAGSLADTESAVPGGARRTMSPEGGGDHEMSVPTYGGPTPRQRGERVSSAPPTSQAASPASSTVGMGMSPAASFLSSFSPTSAPTSAGYGNASTSTTLGPNQEFSRRVQAGRGLGALPPKGDEPGYVLPVSSRQVFGVQAEAELGGEPDEEGEWVLGKELGRGGMGVVREVIWRSTAPAAHATRGRSTTTKRRRKVAVKIVKKDLFSAPGGGSAAGSALEAFGLSPRNGPPSTSSTSGFERPLPGSRAASFQLSLPPSSASHATSTLRNPSKDRILGNSFPSGQMERNRSTSSPTAPPSHLFLPTTGGTGSLSPIEQSPLPSPGIASGSGSTTPALEPDPSPEQTLLLALLNRELTLWAHITSPHPHPNIVPLLSTFETSDFSYVFMPLCDGGSLLSYLNSPPLSRDELPLELLLSSSSARSQSREPSKSTSRSRERGASSASLRGRNTLPRLKPRTSLPFASSFAGSTTGSSPSSSTTRTSRFLSPPPAPQDRALTLDRAGDVFKEIVSGLRWLHDEKRVVHKDFKLENLLSCWEEEEEDEAASETAETGDRSASRGRTTRTGATRTTRWKRVWKLADFGLSELIPTTRQQTPATTTSTAASNCSTKKLPPTVVGVQPLSTLARGGSLSRPNQHHHAPLSTSLGPSTPSASNPSPTPHGSSHSPHRPPAHHASNLVPSVPSSDSLTAHLHPIGSLPYSSPESLKSPIPILDPSVDVWALGCVLYALVEGVLPIYDEWEFRLRMRLIKGEWQVPETLTEVPGEPDEVRTEKRRVLEVLRGCLNKQVDERWTVRQIEESEWLRSVAARQDADKARERDERRHRRRLELELRVETATTALDTEMKDSVVDLPPRSPARGRPATARPLLPPPLLSSSFSHKTSSSAASSTPGSTSTSRSSSSRSLSRCSTSTPTTTNGRPSPDSLAHPHPLPHPHPHSHATSTGPTLRRPSRSTSRSSAYAHQGVDSRTQIEELKERGRSQRRLRWDEEKSTSRRRRSESRDALEGATLDESALGMTTRGRSSSRGSLAAAAVGSSRERGRGGPGGSGTGPAGGGERLETVRDEPY
ncbi:hypothetical protein JCM11491_000270 [Sporobolomyces phaffii]